MVMRGRASHVTDLGDGSVLRVGGDPEREARLMDLARRHGIRAPRVLEVRPDSLVLERVAGPTMAAHLGRRPWELRRQAGVLVALHHQVHRVALADGQLVHRDLHPENVLLAPDGPVLIDWTNAGSGDPAMDVALTWLIMETSAGVPGRMLARLFRRRAGDEPIRHGLEAARAYRLADPNVTDAERERVHNASVD